MSCRTASSLTESELRGQIKKLSDDTRKYTEANNEYKNGNLATTEAKVIELLLKSQREIDYEEATSDSEERFDDVKLTVQANLWRRCGLDTESWWRESMEVKKIQLLDS